ncbi:MAG: LysM peptidoglycan-binding domain-containing protein, partial [Candidatus Eisenbacteria sp.]|nr:LysM peptidoglycan-binding domain-containing protein [Candidatus Eisenbacteria bacterium]
LYQGKGRNSFERSLKRSGRYLGMARRIFAEEGVPQDLSFLAHVESAFRFNARSPKRALGLWQFMRGTARMYGLRCDSHVDERLDPEKSTRAAARLLRDLHARYNDWYLALAAYNAGAGKVDRAIRRAGTRDFWRIARTRYLRQETRNFVPAILAVTILAKSPGAYRLTEEAHPPLEYQTVTVDSPTDLRVVAACTKASLAELQELNPALLLNQTPMKVQEYEVRVPRGTGESFTREFAKIPPDKRLVFHRHKVRRGETLGILGQRYHTTVRGIQDANRMGRRTMIRIGQVLKIPSRGGTYLTNLDRENAVQHEVRWGQCLAVIASRYGVTVRHIQDANGIANPSRIYTGQILLIPPSKQHARSTGKKTSLASASDSGSKASGSVAERSTDNVAESSEQNTSRSTATSDGALSSAHALNTSDSLGRVPTTAHIVQQAREAIRQERELATAQGRTCDEVRVHRVRHGDTLSEIAARYHIGLTQLRRWNGMGRGHFIYPGQELLVSDPQEDSGSWDADKKTTRLHVVKRGESLWKIAKRYRVRVADLANWNSLRGSSTIYPGQELRVY